MNSIIIGRYIPTGSFIHKMDPRGKMIIAISFLIIVFFANNWQSYLVLGAFVLLGVFLSKIPINHFIKGIAPLIWIILFTVALQIFFTTGGTPLFSIGPITIYQEGVINAVLIFFRFVLIITMSTLLTLSTQPLEITDALEFLLRPFSYIGVPVHSIALMLSIALRFVPTLLDEVTKIMNAQRARGMEFSEGSLLERMRKIVPVLIPLFVSSFNRAIELATAMEARGYRDGEGRTKYRKLEWRGYDTLAIGVFLLMCVAVFMVRV